MHRIRRGCLTAGFLISITLGSQPSEAQYTANYQTNTISGVTSNWSGTYFVGNANSTDALVIQYAGILTNVAGILGNASGSSSNSVLITLSGLQFSAWHNGVLYVGYFGSANSLEIAYGLVTATNVIIGVASTTCDNIIELDRGRLVVTNSGTGVLEVRHGELILNGGTLQADTLVMTNACAQFIHTGGTLIVSNVVLDPNTFRITSIAPQGNDILITWMMGPGATNTLQATAGDGSGGYSTNGFTDIFIVTNNTTVGTVTNYLDIGAATNTSSRYYQARLVP